MCNKLNIEASINDGCILTPLACARIISELITCLLYQKSQIPYPFNYLQKAVTKRRRQIAGEDKPLNLSLQNHFRAASKLYDAVLDVFTNIEREFKNSDNVIKEFVVLFGSTYNLAKEAFSVILPRLQHYHNEGVHAIDTQKCVRNILRDILTTDEWLQSVAKTVPVTNMYILLKKYTVNSEQENVFFQPADFTLSPKVKPLRIKLCYDYNVDNDSCCSKINIFGQEAQNECKESYSENEQQESNWYLANISFKGYKDYFVNKVSASELW